MGGVWDKLSEKIFRLRRAFDWILIVSGCVPYCKITIFLYLAAASHRLTEVYNPTGYCMMTLPFAGTGRIQRVLS